MQTPYKHECRDRSPEHTDFLLHLILHEIQYIQQEIYKMATSQADFDTQLQALLTAEASRDAAVAAEITAVDQALTDLIAKVKSGSSNVDLSSELANIQTLATNAATVQANAAAVTATATADDPGTTNVSAPPAA
jgi:hypothetical protein